jgi:hypothetical protein
MGLSRLPAYPDPSSQRPEDAAGDRDWTILLRHLIAIAIVGGIVSLIVGAFAIWITGGVNLAFL